MSQRVKQESLPTRVLFAKHCLVKMRLTRPVVHGLICTLLATAVAGLCRLEEKGVAGHSLTSWEYRFRDAITASGRFLPPDPRLAFLGIDSSSVNFSQFCKRSTPIFRRRVPKATR